MRRNRGAIRHVTLPARMPMSTAVPASSLPHVALGGSFAASAATGASPPDPGVVAEMKQEIRVLVQEVAQLAQSELSPDEFYAAFLPRVVSAMGAIGGVVWSIGESGRLRNA